MLAVGPTQEMTLFPLKANDEGSYQCIRAVCARLRRDDHLEATATLSSDSEDELVKHFWTTIPSASVFVALGSNVHAMPIALLGVWQITPVVGVAQMVATDQLPRIAASVARYVRRGIIPALIEAGMARVEARALASATENCRWLELLGARRECELPLYGKRGETFVQYAWLRGEADVHVA